MSAAIVPTAQQFELAMSKIRLNSSERALLAYLARWSVVHPDDDVRRDGIVKASAETIALETGYAKSTVWHALFGVKGRDGRGAVGLVQRRIVRCWSRGGRGVEMALSVNGNFEEWDAVWVPVGRAKDKEVARQHLLLELQTADFVARMRATTPAYFVARQARDNSGSRPYVHRRAVKLKPRPVWRAPSRDNNDDESPRERATNIIDLPGASPSSRDLSDLSVPKKEREAAAPKRQTRPPELAAATVAVLAAISDVNGGNVPWGPIKDRVVHATCDMNPADVAHVVQRIRHARPRLIQCADLVELLVSSGAPEARRQDCEQCGGAGVVLGDVGPAYRCPACFPEEETS